jgi:hypothetical protein
LKFSVDTDFLLGKTIASGGSADITLGMAKNFGLLAELKGAKLAIKQFKSKSIALV